MTDVTILQLYPEELGVAGDSGNVMALRTRLERANVTVTLVLLEPGDALPESPDLVVVGNGPVSAIRHIYEEFTSHAEVLKELAASGVPFFAYGAGAELLGESITFTDGTAIDGIGVFPLTAVRIREHRVSYTIIDTAIGQIVGFVDNASLWTLAEGADSFGTLVAGMGNADGTSEGVRAGEGIGTQLGGPVLPLNPALTDSIIRSVAARKGFEYSPGVEHSELDHYAAMARDVIIDNVKTVFHNI